MAADQLPYLETFLEAAESGSFTAAARALGISQAAVSQRLHQLEHRLGVALFERAGGRVRLAEAGRRLHPLAQRIQALHLEARAAVGGRRTAGGAGELAVAASSVVGDHLLPPVLSEFRTRHPRVSVGVTVTDSDAALKQLERGRAHLGLVGMAGDSPHLAFRRFATDSLALIVPASHPWAERSHVSLSQVETQGLILREAGSGSRRCLERALEHAGRSLRSLNVALVVGSNEAIKEAVLRGLGAAILSTRTFANEVRDGRLRSLAIRGLSLRRDLLIAWDRRRALPMPANLFLDLLVSRDRKHP